MHDWVCAIIDSQKLLPPAVAKHFMKSSYFTGSAHYDTNDEGRKRLWTRLADQLKGEVDAVLADATLKCEAAPDLSGRPVSKGERLVKICQDLIAAIEEGGDIDALASRLEYEGRGTGVSSDAKQIRKLLAKKRITDMRQFEADLHRHAYHAKIVAQQLYHMD